MYTLRRVFAFLAAVLVLCAVGRAQAQTTAAATLKINKAGVVHSVARTNNRNVTLINRSDCDNDDVISFPISLTNRGSDGIQAWVGTTNCTDPGVRQSTTQTQCWRVYDLLPTGNFPNTPSLDIPVKRMLAGYSCSGATTTTTSGTSGSSSTDTSGGGDTSSGGTSGTTATAGSSTATAGAATTVDPTCPLNQNPIGELVVPDANICKRTAGIPAAGATTLTLYVILVNPSTFAADASDSWVGSFKLVGPPAPDKVTAGIGGNLLVMNFSYSSAPADQTGNGFYLYCDPPPGRDVAVDAGLVEADASVGNTFTCGAPTSQVLVPGSDAPTDGSYRCGGASSKSASSANATNLVDGVAYNVAVAAYDTYDNTGPLSALTCEVPQPVDGFFKGYQNAGGKAGGGFCSFSRHGEPLTLIGVLGFASYLVFRRRRAA